MGIFKKTKKEENKEVLKKDEKVVKEKAEKKSTGKPVTQSMSSDSKRKLLVKQVWITEKGSSLSGLGKYIFIVDKSINKPEIKKAIESIYSVNVVSVNVINSKGKLKRLGRSTGKTSSHKKAIVTLKEGQKIDVMPS